MMRLSRLALALGCVTLAVPWSQRGKTGCVGLASAKQTIWLTAIQPFTGGEWDHGISQVIGGKIMLEQVNAHSHLLRDYDLKIVWQDGMCSRDEGTRVFHANVFEQRYFPFVPNASSLSDLDVDGDGVIEREDTLPLSEEWDRSQISPAPIGILGPGCSASTVQILKIARHTKFHVVSNTASFDLLSDRTEYPNFFRTTLPDTSFVASWLNMAKMLGQSSLVSVIAETQTWASMGERMGLEAQAAGISLLGHDLASEMPGFHGLQVSYNSVAAAAEAAKLLVRYRQRVIVMLMFARRARLVMCEAYKLGLRNAVFMTFGWFSSEWWAVPDTSCTPQQLASMARGFISAQMMYWRFDGDTKLSCSEKMTAREFQEEWFRRQGASFGNSGMRPEGYTLASEASITADAVCVYAQALDALLVGRGLSYEELIARTDRAYADLTELFQASDFEGLQGPVTFQQGSPDPEGSVLLQQLHIDEQGNATMVDIATSSCSGTMHFLGKADLIFGLPDEQGFAGPEGASSISLGLAPFAACGRDQTLDMEHNRCVSCPRGMVYMDIVQDCVCRAGYTIANGSCRECDAGTFAPSDGLAQCSSCPPGHFSAGRANNACDRCPLGNFSENAGSSECTSCESEFGNDMTTEVPGTASRADCHCGGNTYQDAERRECLRCPEGMKCPFGSDIAPGATLKPQLLPSFWSDPQDPLSVFRCEDAHRCPGHSFGACGHRSQGRACAHCEEGWTWDNVQCAPCSSLAKSGLFFPVLPLLLVPIIVLSLYRLFGDQYAMWGSWQNGLAATVFILLNYAQILALMQGVHLDMPESVEQFFRSVAFANDLLQTFSPQCSGFSSSRAMRAVGLVAPAIVLLIALLCWLTSLSLSRLTGHKWLAMESNRAWNVAMSLIYTFFTSIVTISCRLFKCGPNPNGTQSLVVDRSIICFRGEWLDLLAVEITGILVWCLGVGCLFSHAILCSSVRHFHNIGVQMRWKFLFIKYRPDVHWWSLVFMARAVILNLGIIIVQESLSKLYFIMCVLMLYLALLSVYRPWRHRANNLVDGLTQLCLIVVGSLLSRFAVVTTTNLSYFMSQVTVAAFILILILSALLCLSMIWQIGFRSRRESQNDPLEDIIVAFRIVDRARPGDLKKFVEDLGEWDFAHMQVAKNIIMTEFCKVSSRHGVSSNDLCSRTPSDRSFTRQSSWRGTVDWNVVDANMGRCSTASYGSSDALPNRVLLALQLVQGVSRVESVR